LPFAKEYQQEVRTAKFDTELVIKLQEFGWSLLRHQKSSVPTLTPTAWTDAYGEKQFAKG
jgi:hypothetical protein